MYNMYNRSKCTKWVGSCRVCFTYNCTICTIDLNVQNGLEVVVFVSRTIVQYVQLYNMYNCTICTIDLSVKNGLEVVVFVSRTIVQYVQ